MVLVELGCGATRRPGMTYGVDCRPGPGVTHVCAVGFEPLPFAEASVDGFFAWDFLEHLPTQVWERVDGRWQVRYPRVAALREIFRCLVPGGGFLSHTPVGWPQWAQDPTHAAPPWTAETWDYFCGGYPHVAPQYGIDFAFELVWREIRDGYLHVLVRKPVAKGGMNDGGGAVEPVGG
jgi:SAM-dependent methyltransferase